MKARRGKAWWYDISSGWRLRGTSLVLDFDPLDSGGGLRGCWLLSGQLNLTARRFHDQPIDHYLDGAMDWVEDYVRGEIFDLYQQRRANPERSVLAV